MSLATIIRNAGVRTANKVTKSLQVEVTILPWTGQDAFGTDTYGSAYKRMAIVELGAKSFESAAGVSFDTKAMLTFLAPLPVNGAEGRQEPVDERDVITLPDGTTGPTIIGTPIPVDPKTGKPYFQVIGIGK